ncbi:ornithine cyclodeaminase family protein [Bradyrhizobium sp. 23]|uniref:ornithine cyclodeaminase family protein n=1 Tax=Bradyrhizobium sp. 23 TaxID=2782667 RepID=UPI001FF7B3CB|nr:ornithine cyclodeaminase family protein [Bradyrhizobium sp. 23]MCK1315935.1 ornithine cyclodeaminase family protein [Bradyrhizobium sp. 23]
MRYFSAAEVDAGLDYPRLIHALSDAFRRGGEAMPLRQSYDVGTEAIPGHLLTMPAWDRGKVLGVKLVTVFPQNPSRDLRAVSSVYMLLDGATGQPRAMVDGEALTNRRTAAASALASRHLSRADSRTLLMVGTGRLASYLPAAHRAVRKIEQVLVWGRDTQRACSLAGKLVDQGFDARSTPDLVAALSVADIVSCATTSRESLIAGKHLRPGTHVDLVGAFTPQMRETDDDAVCRSRVFVDTYAGALKEAGDLLQPIAAGCWQAGEVCGDLHELTSGAKPGRLSEEEITMFKSVGAAIEDIAAANMLAGDQGPTVHCNS